MAKFHIQAVSRPGYDGAWRAGRKWSSTAPTEVEVLEQDDDPPVDPRKGLQLGKKTFELIKADGNLVVRAPGDPLENAKGTEALVAENARLRAELAQFKASATGHATAEEHAPMRRKTM